MVPRNTRTYFKRRFALIVNDEVVPKFLFDRMSVAASGALKDYQRMIAEAEKQYNRFLIASGLAVIFAVLALIGWTR
jgi:hypothetical protein